MDAQTCLKKLEYVGVLAFATVDADGAPQLRNISAIHYELKTLYFFTARGKEFCNQLLADGRVSLLGYTRFKEMIRLSGIAAPMPESKQDKWRDTIFAEQLYLSNVYPDDTRKIGIVFQVSPVEIEYFNLGVNPIFRERYTLDSHNLVPKGYVITEDCIGCGKCRRYCPQDCITSGTPYAIAQQHCLHCGACFEVCPVRAVQKLESKNGNHSK